MPEYTQNQTEVTDDQLNTEIDELNKKADRGEEDNQKLGELKKERSSRYETKITHEVSARKEQEYKAQLAEERAKRAEEELERLRIVPKEPVSPIKETVTYGEKAYYTDAALQRMLDLKQISETQAYQMQRERDKAETKEEVLTDIEKKNQETQIKAQKTKDLVDVLTEYPQWDSKHENYNPKDPLMIEVVDLYNAGVPIKKAIEKAKKIVGVQGRPDNSDAFSVPSPGAPDKGKKTEIVWTPDENDMAIRTFRDKVNPATRRTYTEAESIAKGKEAKRKQTELKQSRRT